jgi:signal transduction histidine kinase/CheY-like chemotaxis protein
MGGAVVVGPLILVGLFGLPEWHDLARRPSTWIAALALSTCLAVAFSSLPWEAWAGLVVALLAFPFLAWAGISLGPRGAIAGMFLTAAAAVLGTARGVGPFALEDANASLLLLWAYVTTMGSAAMILAASVAEREAAERERELANSRRLELEMQVQHLQRLESLGVLAGGIAHDFNNLLTAIRGNAELVRVDLGSDLRAGGLLGQIERASDQAAGLCDQLLSYAGRKPPKRERITVEALVEEMSSLLRTSVSRHIELETRFSPGVPAVFVDVAQLRQVVMNLIVNAAEAIGDGEGTIVFSTGSVELDRDYLGGTYLISDAPAGTYVYLEVSDDGAGMDEETLERVFEPFFTTKFDGRGLGMAAVVGIVRAHDGAIKVESEPGRGSVFRVLLPAAEGKPARAEAEASRSAEPVGGGTILVADDEEAVLQLVTRALEGAGWATVQAGDGRQAAELFERHQGEIRLVVLDAVMPRSSGLEALAAMRLLRPELPAVMMSSDDSGGALNSSEQYQYLSKPFSLARLIHLVAEGCEGAGARPTRS